MVMCGRAADLSSDATSSTKQERLLDELVEAPQHLLLNLMRRDALMAEPARELSGLLAGVVMPKLSAMTLCHHEAHARARPLRQLFREVPDEKVGVDSEESADVALTGVLPPAISVGENHTGHRCRLHQPARVGVTRASQMRVPLQGRHRDLGRAPSEPVPEFGAEETAGRDVAAADARPKQTASHRPSVLSVNHGYVDIHQDVGGRVRKPTDKGRVG